MANITLSNGISVDVTSTVEEFWALLLQAEGPEAFLKLNVWDGRNTVPRSYNKIIISVNSIVLVEKE